MRILTYLLLLFCQFDEKLGNGAYKEVFLSYDTETGKEVAWYDTTRRCVESDTGRQATRNNELISLYVGLSASLLRNAVTLARLPPNEKKRIRMETEILKELDHPHIINFYHVWENPVKGEK